MSSIQRDQWSGRVYAALSDQTIVSFSADGDDLQTFQTVSTVGRIAIAPDGHLYHLDVGFPQPGLVERFALPTDL